MRTTININDKLLQTAKLRAAETQQTLTAVIEDALRIALQTKSSQPSNRRASISTSGSGGLLPGVDLDNTSAAAMTEREKPVSVAEFIRRTEDIRQRTALCPQTDSAMLVREDRER